MSLTISAKEPAKELILTSPAKPFGSLAEINCNGEARTGSS